MSLYRKPGSKFWWVDVMVAGVRVRQSTKKTKKTHAAQIESEIIHRLRSGEDANIRQKAPQLRDFAPTFLEFVDKSRLDSDTKDYYRYGWRLLSSQSVARMRLNLITPSATETITMDASGSTINCALRTLRRMLSLAAENRLIVAAPRFRLAKERERQRVVSPTEEELILAKGNPTSVDAFILIMDTGARPSEAAAIAWHDVDFVRRTIWIDKSKTDKGRRRLVMTTRVFEMLKKRATATEGCNWVFPAPRRKGHHIKGRSIIGMFCQLKRSLGLPKEVVLYSARHTFGTDFQAAVKDISKTSRQLGHSSIAVTQRYVHPETEESSAAMDERNKQRHLLRHSALEGAKVQ